MDADEIKVVGGSCLDRGIKEANVEIRDAQADLERRIDLFGCKRCLTDEIGIDFRCTTLRETSVKFIPDLPIFYLRMISSDHARDVVAPELNILDRKFPRTAVCGGPR